MLHTADEYLETRVMTARPEELHLMVVDGAIRHATRAEAALCEQDFETAHFALNRAREFTVELIAGLKSEHLPELVAELKGLFGFVYRNLNEADLYRDAEKVRGAIKVLRIHQETWRQLLQERKTAAAGSAPVSVGDSWST
jgi:flagellar secretion chaperone FliS